MQNDEKRIAVFIDFENVAVGVKESNLGNFDIDLVLKRLVEKGKILVKRAYSDWHRYTEFKRAFHQEAIELIDVPQTRYSGKNSADIRMVVDAMDLATQKEHIDTFVLVSGDSDFSPLVSKLRENGRYVIGLGVRKSSSDLLVNNCDEFIYYEDLIRPTVGPSVEDPRLNTFPLKKAEVFRLVLEAFQALQREGKEVIYGSMIKQTLVRKLPSFNENYYGYSMFSRLLEEVAENNFLKILKDQKSGGYIVTAAAEESPRLETAPSLGEPAGETARPAEPAQHAATAATAKPEPSERGVRHRWSRDRGPGPHRRYAEVSPHRRTHQPPIQLSAPVQESLEPTLPVIEAAEVPLADSPIPPQSKPAQLQTTEPAVLSEAPADISISPAVEPPASVESATIAAIPPEEKVPQASGPKSSGRGRQYRGGRRGPRGGKILDARTQSAAKTKAAQTDEPKGFGGITEEGTITRQVPPPLIVAEPEPEPHGPKPAKPAGKTSTGRAPSQRGRGHGTRPSKAAGSPSPNKPAQRRPRPGK